ncbi:flagellin, partial [Bosea sp. BH3]|uniref:flagellin n=1 Tax=Bosea sp. BH3 TaxID=2871701 RepID=UPI0021CAE6AB
TTATTGLIDVAVAGGGTYQIDVSESTTIGDLAKKFRALGIEGLTVGINTAGTGLEFRNRGAAVTITSAADAGHGGVAATTTVTANSSLTTETKKGVLDKTYDVFRSTNGAAAAWGTFSIAGGDDALNISALTDSASDLAALETYVAAVDNALAEITTSASSLGAIKSRVGLQQDFVKSLTDSLDRGIGQLVDADMNAESTRLQALQTQQQLGIQALSIANGNSQSILSLFRG